MRVTKYFAAALAALMEKHGVNQVQLSQSGIAVSRINNYLHGKYRTIKPAHLSMFCEDLAKSDIERGELVQAYLLDLIADQDKDRLEIRVPNLSHGGHKEKFSEGLPKAFAAEFEELYRLCAASSKIRGDTKNWISIMREISAGV